MIKKQLYIVLLTFFLIWNISVSVEASTETTIITEEKNQKLDGVETAKDSVIQYTDDEGNKYLLKSGSGFLISDSVILTSYQNTILTEEEKLIASKYISQKTGKK